MRAVFILIVMESVKRSLGIGTYIYCLLSYVVSNQYKMTVFALSSGDNLIRHHTN